MNIASVCSCPAETVPNIDMATKMKISVIHHKNMVNAVVTYSFQNIITNIFLSYLVLIIWCLNHNHSVRMTIEVLV